MPVGPLPWELAITVLKTNLQFMGGFRGRAEKVLANADNDH